MLKFCVFICFVNNVYTLYILGIAIVFKSIKIKKCLSKFIKGWNIWKWITFDHVAAKLILKNIFYQNRHIKFLLEAIGSKTSFHGCHNKQII